MKLNFCRFDPSQKILLRITFWCNIANCSENMTQQYWNLVNLAEIYMSVANFSIQSQISMDSIWVGNRPLWQLGGSWQSRYIILYCKPWYSEPLYNGGGLYIMLSNHLTSPCIVLFFISSNEIMDYIFLLFFVISCSLLKFHLAYAAPLWYFCWQTM